MSFNGRTLYEAWAWEMKPGCVAPRWEMLDEPHRRAWEALAVAVDRSPPTERIAYCSAMIVGNPIFLGSLIPAPKDESSSSHHRSCAIRRGGNECTC